MNDKTNKPAPAAIIRPTVGRVVWYWRDPQVYADAQSGKNTDAQPMAATIAYVHSDSLVTLHAIDRNGVSCAVPSVPLRQANEGVPNCSFCEWMPYQIGQAARTEQLEKQLDPSAR